MKQDTKNKIFTVPLKNQRNNMPRNSRYKIVKFPDRTANEKPKGK